MTSTTGNSQWQTEGESHRRPGVLGEIARRKLIGAIDAGKRRQPPRQRRAVLAAESRRRALLLALQQADDLPLPIDQLSQQRLDCVRRTRHRLAMSGHCSDRHVQ
jgi:hypothetical protein